MPNKLGRTRGMGRDRSESWGGYLKKEEFLESRNKEDNVERKEGVKGNQE